MGTTYSCRFCPSSIQLCFNWQVLRKVYILKDLKSTMQKTKVEVTKIITQYATRCKHCGLRIVGNSESQVDYNMDVHVRQKHSKKKETKQSITP